MMGDCYKLTAAEREIMEALWNYSEPIQTKDLLELMNEKGKEWKRQTLNTLLFRLEEKGIVSRKRAYVQAILTEESLLQKQTQEILNDFYGGKLRNFCAALMGNDALGAEEADSLYALIDELKNK